MASKNHEIDIPEIEGVDGDYLDYLESSNSQSPLPLKRESKNDDKEEETILDDGIDSNTSKKINQKQDEEQYIEELDIDIPITEDKQVTKRIIKLGNGDRPAVMSRVFVHLEVKTEDNTVVFSKMHEEHDFLIGRAQLCTGIEMSVITMRPNERAILHIGSEYSYNDRQKPENCPSKVPIIVDITLLHWNIEKSLFDLTFEDKIVCLKNNHRMGNERFAETKYQTAAVHYNKAISYIINIMESHSKDISSSLKSELQSIRSICFANIASVDLKNNDYNTAMEHIEQSLDLDPSNLKALYKRGIIKIHLDQPDEANEDFETCLKNPKCNDVMIKNIKQQMVVVKKCLKEKHQKEKKLYGNWLQKHQDLNLYPDKTLPSPSIQKRLLNLFPSFSSISRYLVDNLYYILGILMFIIALGLSLYFR